MEADRDVQVRQPKALLRLPEVKRRTGRCRSAIYADISAGRFPAAVPIGARSVAWLESEIEAWIDEQIAHRKVRS